MHALSRPVFMRILNEALSGAGLEVVLTDSETDQLYQEPLYYFGTGHFKPFL